MRNVLTDPVIRTDMSSGSRVVASLPEVYAALMADEVDAFPPPCGPTNATPGMPSWYSLAPWRCNAQDSRNRQWVRTSGAA